MSEITSVKVLNLPPNIDSATLESMFSLIGNVVDSKVVYHEETGTSLGFGFVEMKTPAEVQDCIQYYNGWSKLGWTMYVRENKPHVAEPMPLKKKRAQ